MTLNRLILDTLRPTGVPVDFQVTTGSSSTYITFFMVVGVPKLHADDELKKTEQLIQVDIWSKTDYTDLVTKVKSLMKGAGFSFSSERELYEKDTEIYHYVITYRYSMKVS